MYMWRCRCCQHGSGSALNANQEVLAQNNSDLRVTAEVDQAGTRQDERAYTSDQAGLRNSGKVFGQNSTRYHSDGNVIA